MKPRAVPPRRPAETAFPRITVLVDNDAAPGLAAEHGLSLWVETRAGNLLFDTGAGAALRPNASALGVRLERTDAIVLSHGHYDHTGGLPAALELAPAAPVFAHPGVARARYRQSAGKAPAPIGLPPPAAAALRAMGAAWVRTRAPREILPGVWATGAIPRRREGGADRRHSLDRAGRQPDPVADDQAVWIATPSGTVALLGCAHAGAGNTLEYIRRRTGGAPFRAVIGGLHLGHAGTARIEALARALTRLGVAELCPLHCTGDRATALLSARLPGRVRPLRAGDRWTPVK